MLYIRFESPGYLNVGETGVVEETFSAGALISSLILRKLCVSFSSAKEFGKYDGLKVVIKKSIKINIKKNTHTNRKRCILL